MKPEGNYIATLPSPTVQHPSDLAALVHSYLFTGVGRTYREKDGLPDLQVITQLFEVLFHLSLQAEEGHQITCAAAFMSPLQTVKAHRPRRLQAEVPPLFSTQTEATKVAADNGYRLIRGIAGAWIRFGSTTAPCDIFIAYTFTGDWLLSIEHTGVARELPESKLSGPGAKTIAARTLYELHQVLDRTYRLSISLPTVPFVAFEHETSGLPRTTEAERLVVMRVGQEIFRKALMDYWNGACPLTGITDPALLRASHIVPWAECETDSLRLNVYNGLLLSSLWDSAFDAGMITFSREGIPIAAPILSASAARALRLDESPVIRGITQAHELMLVRHRAKHDLIG